MQKGNIFSEIPKSIPKEVFNSIIDKNGIKIERIISKGHTTEKDKWYNQEKNEWLIILKGNAELEFEDNKKVSLKEGDYVNIPAHTKHRVTKTSKKEETIWLIVHY
ncbi:cupin [Candidatus Pacearchaeota archaeon CG1_02_32_132]|nr:MAG: cupin [Candidatus Pacearchaeota archaeon CG1_02_32_132]